MEGKEAPPTVELPPGPPDWRRLYAMTTGATPEREFMEPYEASLLFFAITALVGVVGRSCSAVLPRRLGGLVAIFFATMEACAYFYENNFVLKYYGSLWFAIAIIGQCFVLSRTLGGASENPVQAIGGLMSGSLGLVGAAVQIGVQMLAGLASYKFAKAVWALDFISDHHERYYEVSCGSDLQVTFLIGFAIELGACLVDTWLNMQTISSMSLLDELIKYTNAAAMIALGVATTGMYFNPAMASGHTLGCVGTPMWEHFFVYWAGPFVGYFVALQLDKMIHIDVTRAKVEQSKKKTN